VSIQRECSPGVISLRDELGAELFLDPVNLRL
jgi:hypothetical protein